MFPFKFEIIEGLVQYWKSNVQSQPGLDHNQRTQMNILSNSTKSEIKSNLLTYFLMFVAHEDKKPVFDHIKYHKLHHYNVKVEDGKKEIMDNIPDMLTTHTEFDDETNYLMIKLLDVGRVNANEGVKLIHNYLLNYFEKNHPQHYVCFYIFYFLNISLFIIFYNF